MRKSKLLMIMWTVSSFILQIAGIIPRIGFGPGFTNNEDTIYATDSQILFILVPCCAVGGIVFLFVHYYAQKEGSKIIKYIARLCIIFSVIIIIIGVLSVLGIVPRGVIIS